MVDKVQIEGSAERAADRGQNMFADLGVGDLLNSTEVVEGLVRQFLGELVDIRKGYNADTLESDRAITKVMAAANRYADVFMGKDSAYTTLPWNTPEQLGAHLKAVLGTDSEPEGAALDYFLRVASDFTTEVLQPFEDDAIAEDVMRFRTDALVDDATHALLGLRQDEPEE